MRHPRRSLCLVAALVLATLGPAVTAVAVHDSARPQLRLPAARTDVAPAVVPEAPGPAPAPEELVEGVAVFGDRRPAAPALLDALAALGLRVQGLDHLPLALLRGTQAQLDAVVARGLATAVHPNRRLSWFSGVSNGAMKVDPVRAAGITGKGVGVAVVDSGVDATHPDLADHVTHNVKIVDAEYANLGVANLGFSPRTPPGPIKVAVDEGPYNNSDLTSGHGTHVAGIVAADGHTSADQMGVAPDAHLVAYATGEYIYVFSVLAAFDDILAHHREWGIRVVNNSWGDAFRAFDPEEPINVATKALHDAGLVVVFAAGNAPGEMTINPYSVAPWVISVAAANYDAVVATFSAGGLPFDNAEAHALPDDDTKHVHVEGDGLGFYRPDLSAPGVSVVSSGTPTGIAMGPTAPGGAKALSGTSMATPHVSGLAALLLQVRPDLTPAEVRRVMEVTTAPMSNRPAFFRSGYGFADAQAAVALVQRPDFGPALLDQLGSERDAAARATRPYSVRATDLWSLPGLTLGEASPNLADLDLLVPAGTRAIKALVGVPPTGDLGLYYQLVLLDAAGAVVAQSESTNVIGVSSLFADLAHRQVSYGLWRLQVQANPVAQVANTVQSRPVVVHVAQLGPPPPPPVPYFVAQDQVTFHFQPGGDAGILPSPEGCAQDVRAPQGALAPAVPQGQCRSGPVGWATGYGIGDPAVFLSHPLEQPVTIGGRGALTLYLADPLQPVYNVSFAATLAYLVSAVDAAGNLVTVAVGAASPRDVSAGPSPVRGEYVIVVPPATIPAGSRLRLQLRVSGVPTSAMRLLYGGGQFADAGVTFTRGFIVN